MGYFKNISCSLARKYPDRKVFVISDHHFYHYNIIKYTRSDLFESKDLYTSINSMHNHIISNHNAIVGEDDIVLVLGDFSFKTGVNNIKELNSKLNGHKFIILGNHDKIDNPSIYLKAGFEDVFLSPIQFNGDYYSHYPLNASEKSKDKPDTILYHYLTEEFKNSDSGINFHGHQHTLINNGKREKNVTCEQIDYKPIFVGRTKSYLETNKDNLPYIDDELFDIMHEIMSKYHHIQENRLIKDYLYTMFLELLTPYKDQLVTYGSVMLNKKYDLSFNPSDLDITKLYDSSKSIQTNRKTFKEFGNKIYKKLVQVDGINPDFYKKIDFICILSFIYSTKKGNFSGYLDMNLLFEDFYKSDDFINVNGSSLIERYGKKVGVTTPETIKYPKFNIQTTNSFADIVNCFLQYIYTTDNQKKILLKKKIQSIINKADISTQKDFDKLQNMMIRYLLRNLFFLENTRRKNESNFILLNRELDIPSFVGLNSSIGDSLRLIVNDKEYNNILDSVQNSSDRKKEITKILKNYK